MSMKYLAWALDQQLVDDAPLPLIAARRQADDPAGALHVEYSHDVWCPVHEAGTDHHVELSLPLSALAAANLDCDCFSRANKFLDVTLRAADGLGELRASVDAADRFQAVTLLAEATDWTGDGALDDKVRAGLTDARDRARPLLGPIPAADQRRYLSVVARWRGLLKNTDLAGLLDADLSAPGDWYDRIDQDSVWVKVTCATSLTAAAALEAHVSDDGTVLLARMPTIATTSTAFGRMLNVVVSRRRDRDPADILAAIAAAPAAAADVDVADVVDALLAARD